MRKKSCVNGLLTVQNSAVLSAIVRDRYKWMERQDYYLQHTGRKESITVRRPKMENMLGCKGVDEANKDE